MYNVQCTLNTIGYNIKNLYKLFNIYKIRFELLLYRSR